MLRDITIENYRLFEKFQIEGLNQINLLVGANNSGKSSLLEAIYLLINHENPLAVFDVLENRGEFAESDESFITTPISEMFRGHKLQESYQIGISSKLDVQISTQYIYIIEKDDPPTIKRILKEQDHAETFGYYLLDEYDFAEAYSKPLRLRDEEINKRFLTAEHLELGAITKLWDQIVLTPKEDLVTDALRILDSNLERIALTAYPKGTLQMNLRVKIKGSSEPVPLGSMGDGMYRIFALALSLVNCENGALFVDEIDTGLHHKALTKMWRLVIETAKRLNIQVFATTHSWDCLASFHKALNETEETDLGSVFRLERKNGQIGYVAYTGEELAVAVKHDIEMR